MELTIREPGTNSAPDSLFYNKAGKGSVAEWYTYFSKQHKRTSDKRYLSLPTDNHDSPRIANRARTDAAQSKVAMTSLLTQSGIHPHLPRRMRLRAKLADRPRAHARPPTLPRLPCHRPAPRGNKGLTPQQELARL